MNKLSIEHIESLIIDEEYHIFNMKNTICCLTLKNGFQVIGNAGVVDKSSFNEDIGKKVSKQKAIDQIWLIEGYLLQQRLFDQK